MTNLRNHLHLYQHVNNNMVLHEITCFVEPIKKKRTKTALVQLVAGSHYCVADIAVHCVC